MKKWLLRTGLVVLVGMVLFVGVAFVRTQLARNASAQETQALSASAPLEIGQTSKFEVIPLYENAGEAGWQTGHGVSYLIRTDDTTILFDLGDNPSATSPSPLEQNLSKLGISLSDIDQIVMSHRHPDHIGGQTWWIKNTFSMDGASHPSLGDVPIYVPEPMTYPGSNPALVRTPTRLAADVATTGLITYAQPFPVWLAMPKGDEQALAVNVAGEGIVLVTGCGHMGLQNLLERAQVAFKAPVIGVVGGLHYGEANAAALQGDIEALKRLDPILVALSPHDSGPAALDAFAQAFPAAYRAIEVGTPITLAAAQAHR
jgi:7,8-dihydropterin-6-yl-methyl-4-(beta-D-ribofuranosyl)aminobenzene 5'-phosphate synthase